MFGQVYGAGLGMLALLNGLLEVAKIESTVGTFHLARIDVRSLVRDVAAELAPLLGAKQIPLDLQLSSAALIGKVDPLRFPQVMRNVIANAIRFSPPGKPLQVRGDIDGDRHIRISVRDRGPGIPPAELEHISCCPAPSCGRAATSASRPGWRLALLLGCAQRRQRARAPALASRSSTKRASSGVVPWPALSARR